ncbi:MAG: nucleotidyl transferase AbiEii/AbiGii toxin family protein [bacterium]|nr:nucleotidyl transferase AbiEii/AbiGii toxin family protein [bacterium]MDZ4299795.1 nucleotidyl transferase AbiEii/AbiGii toxin family protein [Candidatus Sungbacteria bacterium]
MEHASAVSRATRDDLEKLVAKGITRGFYLAGGTGLALLFNHRESRDLDFFSEAPFTEDALVAHLTNAGTFALEKKEEGTVLGQFNNTRVSFFHYPYPLLEAPSLQAEVLVASPSDIGCMKLDALASRGLKRDFFDLYTILHKTDLSLSDLLRIFEKKFSSVRYNMMHIKKGLVYFVDAEHDPMPNMLEPIAWETVRDFFLTETKKLGSF